MAARCVLNTSTLHSNVGRGKQILTEPEPFQRTRARTQARTHARTSIDKFESVTLIISYVRQMPDPMTLGSGSQIWRPMTLRWLAMESESSCQNRITPMTAFLRMTGFLCLSSTTTWGIKAGIMSLVTSLQRAMRADAQTRRLALCKSCITMSACIHSRFLC